MEKASMPRMIMLATTRAVKRAQWKRSSLCTLHSAIASLSLMMAAITVLEAVSALPIVKSQPVNSFQLKMYCSALLPASLDMDAFEAILQTIKGIKGIKWINHKHEQLDSPDSLAENGEEAVAEHEQDGQEVGQRQRVAHVRRRVVLVRAVVAVEERRVADVALNVFQTL